MCVQFTVLINVINVNTSSLCSDTHDFFKAILTYISWCEVEEVGNFFANFSNFDTIYVLKRKEVYNNIENIKIYIFQKIFKIG